uniref:Uncharacterized protein n=1 Tax=Echinococcus granulosus TaxID=6210 RepID=A0A068WBJ7_ECHGR|nr:hypothetical protein EgrG_000746500 [Echinococcus granulosus]
MTIAYSNVSARTVPCQPLDIDKEAKSASC